MRTLHTQSLFVVAYKQNKVYRQGYVLAGQLKRGEEFSVSWRKNWVPGYLSQQYHTNTPASPTQGVHCHCKPHTTAAALTPVPYLCLPHLQRN